VWAKWLEVMNQVYPMASPHSLDDEASITQKIGIVMGYQILTSLKFQTV
jgi:hypothetical protein